MAFEAEPIEDCVDSSVAAIDNMKETETELAELKAHILSLTEKLKTANTKIEQLEQTVSDMEFYIENIEDTDVCFYTGHGFPNRQVYNAVLAYLNLGANGENLEYTRNESRPDVNSTPIRKIGRPRKLTPTNQFFLFLCRVRLGLFERDLAYRFNISIGTVSNVVISWANFLYLRLGSLSI